MVPLIELRGAVPFGVGMQLDLFWVYVLAILGNMLPVPFIYFFARKILVWGSDKKFIGKFFKFCLEKGEKGGKKLQGTGAWTGTLAASMLDMDFKSSVIAVMLGVILAGIIMGLASMGLFGGLSAIFAPK